METVTTVPHQDDGYARIPAHTNLKQGAVLPLGPLDQASRDFYFLTGPYSALKQLQKMDHCPSASHKNMEV